ncbi:unnamed protein product [Microthlaspi erraticum]|uniref:DNA (cytosine-5-)-methyltransferase n=1 Tax=Microthlaspi erraticum TaxID=1685480 RepID=A0A6D2IXC6_9BRAS|nr:unnamed protein product [Microthlaspi erraticum]
MYRPFGRLWWDEIVNTIVTRAEPHNQCVLHPLQDRVLTVRENARIQGFPDFYKLCGKVKEKYIQVGNAVAVPVGIALGYAYGMASQRRTDDKPVIKLPFMYPQCMMDMVIPEEMEEQEMMVNADEELEMMLTWGGGKGRRSRRRRRIGRRRLCSVWF